MKKFDRFVPQHALLSTVLGVSALFLSACGGGGSTAPTANKVNGAVIDGYITGAKVCLDTNANLKCDDAINTFSGANGSYSLNIPDGVDTSKYHVVADVVAGAVDSDTPNAPITKAYTLLAPATDATVVTPLTTFVSQAMLTTPSLSVAEAKTEAIKNLNLPANTNFAKDYIASSDTPTHQVASMAAAVLGQVQTDVVTAVAPSTDAQKIEALKRALKEAQAVIAQYAQTAAAATSGMQQIKEAAANTVAKSVETSKTTIKNEVAQQAAIGSSTVASWLDFFKTDNMFDVWSSNTVTTSNGSSTVSYYLEGQQVSATDGNVTFKRFSAAKNASIWTNGARASTGTSSASSAFTHYAYSYNQDKWVEESDTAGGTITMNADGVSSTYASAATKDTEKVSFSVLDVSGKKASDVPRLLQDDGYCGTTKCPDFADFTFPTGSKVLNGTFYRNQDTYTAGDCTQCTGVNYWDSSQNKSVSIANLSTMVTFASGATSNNYVWIGGSPSKLEKTSDTAGNITFMKADYSKSPVTYSEAGKGVYTITTLGGKKVMVVRVTSEVTPGTLTGSGSGSSSYVSTPNSTQIFVEMNGKLLYGNLQFKGLEGPNSSRPSLNRVAINAFFKAQGYPDAP